MLKKVVTYHLEMNNVTCLKPAAEPPANCRIYRVEIPCPEYNRFLYTAVGAHWYWIDRLPWSYTQWEAYVDRPELETWVVYIAGTPAGYFELEKQPESTVEIVYFGLFQQFIGQGIGGWLLTSAVEKAWKQATNRVWVHTCSLDHPAALRNYLSRGFTLFKEEEALVEFPDTTPCC